MALKKDRRLSTVGRVVAIVVATLAISFLADFGRRALDIYRVHRQVEAVESEVATARDENQALKELLAYVATEAYLEEAARELLHWVKPGEVPVVIVPVGENAPETTRQRQDQDQKSYWRLWWELFFGSGL